MDLKLLLKRGALLAAANWPTIAIQFVAETTFQAPAMVLALMVLALVTFVIYDTSWHIAGRGEFTVTAESLGRAFFKPYIVPFEVASVLLVVAMVGAIVLTQDDEDEEARAA